MNRLFLSSVITLTVFTLASCTSTPTTAQSPATASPAASQSAASPKDAMTPKDAITMATVRSGSFTAGEHATEGNVKIVEENGKRLIQFESNFKTDQGPDLFVILHRSDDVIGTTAAPNHSINEADYVAIAPLQTTAGIQRYEIPAEVDLANYKSIAIWCRQFNATFGAASLTS